MGKFRPGQSGNLGGRPPGRRDRRAQLRELIDAEAAELVAVAVRAAKGGDLGAVALLLSRCISPLRPVADPVQFDMPAGASLADQARAVLAGIAAGKVDPMTGRSLIDALAGAARVIETDELLRRIEALEGGADEP